ncbi:hypothetical protein EG352_20740 [Chryseobacterium indologenes]|uniref:Uncharacterized protein n=1 Tax=Chryseobacterium indologenes TaxID=253 RepID=A0AAD0YYP7_CHRID|nr:hypothetical protein [Chryseobacterium indologenes]AZB20003.1 hypothetical protein EG352_20740 [Chryseobacterium indologenes]
MRAGKFTILCFSLFFYSINGQSPRISHDSISVFFNELKTASQKSASLWNEALYGPVLFIDPKTRDIFANEKDAEGLLQLNADVYTGILPVNINIANTAINWKGKRWAMIMLPLPENKQKRIGLLAHESFHRIQPLLGFELNNTENNHLDQRDGRMYLRLELEALKKAIQSVSDNELKEHLTRALSFRKYRHNLYDGSALSENLLELNEGMAEFTGVIVSNRNKRETAKFLTDGINGFFNNPTFVRSFAYHTIPVYGYLLYDKDKNWNKNITAKTDLTDYFVKAFKISISSDLENAVKKESLLYNGSSIAKDEGIREEKKKKRIAEYKSQFIEQPHFEIKFEKMNVSFDPRNIIPVEDKGTVYPVIRVTDKWGVLTVEKGALMSPNWDKISITNPKQAEDKKISGEGWTLDLADGYMIKKDEVTGNQTLVKK